MRPRADSGKRLSSIARRRELHQNEGWCFAPQVTMPRLRRRSPSFAQSRLHGMGERMGTML